MSETKATHTPGTWTFNSVGSDGSIEIWATSDKGLSTLIYAGRVMASRRRITESRANARLIAAAPDLLANLKNILSCANAIVGADPSDPEATEAFDMFDDARRKARAAIVKATGA